MKNTVKTSRVAGQLEKMFRALNTRFFGGELEEVIITLKKTPGAYGHITCGKTWNAGGKERHEINISTATLDRPIEETTATLLHEMCHLYNLIQTIVMVSVSCASSYISFALLIAQTCAKPVSGSYGTHKSTLDNMRI